MERRQHTLPPLAGQFAVPLTQLQIVMVVLLTMELPHQTRTLQSQEESPCLSTTTEQLLYNPKASIWSYSSGISISWLHHSITRPTLPPQRQLTQEPPGVQTSRQLLLLMENHLLSRLLKDSMERQSAHGWLWEFQQRDLLSSWPRQTLSLSLFTGSSYLISQASPLLSNFQLRMQLTFIWVLMTIQALTFGWTR